MAHEDARPAAIDAPGGEPDRTTISEIHVLEAREGTLTVADHRIRFRRSGTTRDIHFSAGSVRRIQLDIEQGRPATLVIVPDEGGREAEVLTVDRSEYRAMTTAFLHLAIDLDDESEA